MVASESKAQHEAKKGTSSRRMHFARSSCVGEGAAGRGGLRRVWGSTCGLRSQRQSRWACRLRGCSKGPTRRVESICRVALSSLTPRRYSEPAACNRTNSRTEHSTLIMLLEGLGDRRAINPCDRFSSVCSACSTQPSDRNCLGRYYPDSTCIILRGNSAPKL